MRFASSSERVECVCVCECGTYHDTPLVAIFYSKEKKHQKEVRVAGGIEITFFIVVVVVAVRDMNVHLLERSIYTRSRRGPSHTFHYSFTALHTQAQPSDVYCLCIARVFHSPLSPRALRNTNSPSLNGEITIIKESEEKNLSYTLERANKVNIFLCTRVVSVDDQICGHLHGFVVISPKHFYGKVNLFFV